MQRLAFLLSLPNGDAMDIRFGLRHNRHNEDAPKEVRLRTRFDTSSGLWVPHTPGCGLTYSARWKKSGVWGFSGFFRGSGLQPRHKRPVFVGPLGPEATLTQLSRTLEGGM
jgi:hypothetical protein